MDIEKKPKKKRFRFLLILLLVVAAVAIVTASVVFILFSSGRKSIQESPEVIVLPASVFESAEASSDDSEQIVHNEVLDEYTIRRGDKLYRQKQDTMTFLFIGVDKDTSDEIQTETYRSNARADVLLLAIMDPKEKKAKFLTLSRDTMCNLELYDTEGNFEGVGYGQLALSYRYGDGLLESCRLTQKAVSELLYNLPIQGVSAIYLDGVGVINDEVGGITLKAIETIDEFTEGEELTLDADSATKYIQVRESTQYGNLKRMERQKQYFQVLLKKVIGKIKQDPTCVLSLYRTVAEYMVTDISVNEILYLASEAIQMDISGDVISVPGEISLNEQNYAEYHIDEKATADLIIDLYYEEIEQ